MTMTAWPRIFEARGKRGLMAQITAEMNQCDPVASCRIRSVAGRFDRGCRG